VARVLLAGEGASDEESDLPLFLEGDAYVEEVDELASKKSTSSSDSMLVVFEKEMILYYYSIILENMLRKNEADSKAVIAIIEEVEMGVSDLRHGRGFED